MANEQPGESLRVDTDGGKYTYIIPQGGGAYALRYGKPWIEMVNLPGSGIVMSLAYDLDEARSQVAALQAQISQKDAA